MTVAENVALPLRLAKRRSEDRAAELVAAFWALEAFIPHEQVSHRTAARDARTVGNGLDGMQRLVGRVWGEVRSPLYRNALFLMMNPVVGAGLGFFFWAIVTRVYSTADIGFAVTLFSAVSFAATLALLGQTVSIIRFLPEAKDQADLLNVSISLVGLASILIAGAFLLVIAVFGLALSFVLESPVYIGAIILGAFAICVGSVYDNAAVGLRRADLTLWRSVMYGLLKIAIAVSIAVTLKGPLGIGRLGVFLALVSGMAVSVIFEAFALLPRVLPGYRPRPRFGFSRLRPMFHFSAGNHVAISVGAAGGSLLTPMILLINGAAAVTYFYVAITVAGLLGVIPASVFASFYAEASQKNMNGLMRHRDERRAILLSVALLAPAIIVMWVFAQFLLYVFFGKIEYADNAIGPLRIMIFSSVPAIFGNVLVTRVRVRKRSLPLVVGGAINTVVNLGLGYFLLLAYGINGLALATVLGGIAPLPYYYFVARKSFRGEEETPPITPVEM